MTMLRITVLGSGSVRLAFAATFAQAGADVTVLARGAAVQQLRQAGITVTGVGGEHRIEAHRLKVSDLENPDPEDIRCDLLIVATKAYQVRDALSSLLHPLGDAVLPQAVLLLQNGWGSANEVRDILPESVAIFSSIMMIGISRRSAGHVHVNVQASPVRVGTLFASAAHGMQAAVGALTKMTYGELVTNANTRDLIAKLADETIRCMHAERKHLLAANGVAYFETALMPLVIPRGAAHRSSMLQDVEAGRRTEIDYLNGAVVRMGQSHGIATPFNEVVSGLIRASCPTD